MNQKEIHDLIKLINKTEIREVKIKDGDFKISIKAGMEQATAVVPTIVQAAPAAAVTSPATPSAPAPKANVSATEPDASNEAVDDDSKYTVFKSPMVGTFYRKPAPEKPVFAKVGDIVKTGDVLCVIEAMKLFNEIECEIDGTFMKILVDDATPVEYDQPLFLIDPA